MAIGDVIARLSVQLGLETAVFEKNAKSASRTTKKMGDDAEALGFRIGRMGKAFIAAGVAIAGTQIVGTLVDMAKQGLETASALGEQAAQLGVTTKALQEYRFVASQTGIEQEQMDAALAKLTKSMGEAANGAKKPAEAFEKLGIDIKAFVASGKDAGDLLPLMAAGLGRLGSEGDKAATGAAIMGRNFQTLMPLLNEGASGIDRLRQEAHDLGIVLSDEMIQQADEAADKMTKLQNVLKMQIASFVAANAEEISALADELLKLASAAIDALNKWLAFRRAMNARDEAYAKGDAYLDSRKDLKPATRERAKQIMRPLIDKKIGINTEDVGGAGLFTLKRTTVSTPGSVGNMQALANLPPLDFIQEAIDAKKELDDSLFQKKMGGKTNDLEVIAREAEIASERFKDLKGDAKDTADAMSTSLEDASNRIIGAFDRISSSFRGGSWLDKLGAILNLGMTLGGLGVFGSKTAERIKTMRAPRIGGFAKGTGNAPRGWAWTGEDGPELVKFRGGERVLTAAKSRSMAGGGSRVQIVPSPYFDVVVDGRVMRAAPGIAGAGSTGAQVAIAKKQSRAFP